MAVTLDESAFASGVLPGWALSRLRIAFMLPSKYMLARVWRSLERRLRGTESART